MRAALYIFDMGGVVACNTDVFPDVLDYLAISWEKFLAFAGEDLGRLFNGKISPSEFWARFSRRYGREVKEELFGKFFHAILNRSVTALIRQLKLHSRVVCGTNTFDPHYDYHLHHGHYAVFDAVFASNKIGLSKPDPEFYRHILSQEAFLPEDAYFVDDMEENVGAARRIGINAILFTDPNSLKIQMKNHRRP
jgi:HAD superfamily hydrolase (TIGR01509 family)